MRYSYLGYVDQREIPSNYPFSAPDSLPSPRDEENHIQGDSKAPVFKALVEDEKQKNKIK